MQTDDDVLQWCALRAGELMSHLVAAHPQDRRTQDLRSKLRAVVLLPAEESVPVNGTWKNGKFKHSTGQLFVAPRDTNGAIRSESSLTKTLVHELAHATRTKEPGEAAHSQQWKANWLWLLEVATKELGWTADIKCAECTFYGLCEQSQCPKCNWLQNLCRPYVGEPR